MLLDRVRPWFDALDKPTICVTHGGVIRILFKLVENLPVADAAAMDVVQDRVLRLKNSRLEWL
jgi:broad specificity phosphatase PhoE